MPAWGKDRKADSGSVPESKVGTGHTSLITALKEVIAVALKPYADVSQAYALLDFPNHANVGDGAIWLGELAYFKSVLNSRPAFVCERDNFDANGLERAVPTGTLFLHGGGNFGDVWPAFQVFRESVLARFPDRLVVQLPQSIHFTDSGLLKKTAAAIKAHGNFVLFVRDRPSFEIASSSFDCPVHLAPDMAFWLGAIPRPVAATRPLLFLLRTDKESARHGTTPAFARPRDSFVADWLEEDPALYSNLKRQTLATSFRDLGLAAFSRIKQRDVLFEKLATNRLARGLNLLSSASFVITDRLHCHILCVLLGIPHIAFDNSYGKLGRFIDAWTKDCGLVRLVPSLDDAIDLWSVSQTGAGSSFKP